MNGVSLKNVPNIVWVCLTAVMLALITAFVVLAVTGTSAAEFRSFLDTVFNFVLVLLSGSGLVFAGVAAKNAQDAKEQTNGGLEERMKSATLDALQQHEETNGGSDNG